MLRRRRSFFMKGNPSVGKAEPWMGSPVRVVWGDAWVDNALGFITPEEASQLEALPVASVGILVASTKEGVTICRETSQGGSQRGMQFIPKKCIKSIKILK
jgi:hypothetical protein